MKQMKQLTDYIVKLTETILMVLVAGLVALIVYELTIRNLLNKSFRASIEICGILFMWMAFLGIIVLYDKSRMMRFDVLISRVGEKLAVLFWYVNKAFSLLLGVVMVVAFVNMYPFFSTRYFSTIPSLPYTIMFLPMAVSGSFIALKTIFQLIETSSNLLTGKGEVQR